MKNVRILGLAIAVFASLDFASSALADPPVAITDSGSLDAASAERAYPGRRPYSPYAGRDAGRRPFFGDTHLHTSLSMDAGAFGARLGLKDAYRFARGEEVTTSGGQPVRLSRPLDFLIVTDHSDNMGFFGDLSAGSPEILADATGRDWYNMLRAGMGARLAIQMMDAYSHGTFPPALLYGPGTLGFRHAWQQEIGAAEQFNEPGRFTALLGYEWTSNQGGNDLHRNVIFRDGGEKAGLVEPFTSSSAQGSDDPAALWRWMAAYEQKTGGSVLAIPHGGNLSNGRMFPAADAYGKQKLDAAYAAERARWEPLYEVTQTMGDSETHPVLSPDDEFAMFERIDKGNTDLSAARTDDMLAGEYARAALKSGLEIAKGIGANPYRFGFAGGSDSHTGLSAVEEDNFFGRVSASEPSALRLRTTYSSNDKTGLKIMDWEIAASGFTAVWAKENTRESLWDAMKRRETYATTGSRLVVRFFAGWEFKDTDAANHDLSAVGYRKGVPMGGDLGVPPLGNAHPTFLVSAEKDAVGANLDRYQIVKGWLDGAGEVHEKIYDVAVSGDRKIDADGRCKTLVGSTVDKGGDAVWSNSIGAPELSAVWTDPDFDAGQSAFYYGRVIEIPTPRWTYYDVSRLGGTTVEGVPRVVAERAYTSPVWYAPAPASLR